VAVKNKALGKTFIKNEINLYPMKKLLAISIMVLFFAFSGKAQTEKSTMLLGGSFSFQSTDDVNIFIANPNVGFFIKKNIALGAEFTLIAANSTTSWSIGPYARAYFAGNTKGSFFGQAGISVGGSGGPDADLRLIGKAGYALFLNKSVALEFYAGYHSVSDDPDLFLMGVGFQIHLKK
jgi:hypothetical protein